MTCVGILGLQGDFAKHRTILSRLNVNSKDVRYPGDLKGCDGLIIPGGESTTMSKLLDTTGVRTSILEFSKSNPVLGTCAGMILMAKRVDDSSVHPLGLLDIEAVRNAYGRQVDSFTADLRVDSDGDPVSMTGIFIRAPKIKSVGEGVRVLGSLNGDPVFVQQGRHLACSFHPELSDNTTIHRYFLSVVEEPTLVK